eukprot:403369055
MLDLSVFYGELVHIHQESQQIYYNLDEIEESQKGKLRQVRHGYGIQLFGRSQQDVLVQYSGQFDRDMKHGQGKFIYPDGSTYEGNFRNDKFDGYGIYKFIDGREYKGYWSNGKMEGGGELKYSQIEDNQNLTGLFKNNLYNHENIAHLNPNQWPQQQQVFLQNVNKFKVAETKRKLEIEQRVRLYRVYDNDSLLNALNETRQQNRTTLFISSVQGQVNYEQTRDRIAQLTYINEAYCVSLREFELAYRTNKDEKQSIMQQTQAKLSMLLLTQGRLYLLFDQFEDMSQTRKGWKELYDPDIDHLINPQCLPSEIWHPNELRNHELLNQLKMVGPDDFYAEREEKLNSMNFNNFGFHVWSKERFNADLSDEELMTQFKKRFEKNLPLKHINLIFIHQLEE